MMVQILIPSCSPAASKTDEILSRYRPIAPKPEHPALPNNNTDEEAPPNHHHKMMKHSPYLRNIWAHLQARPTRARKRGRGSTSLAAPSLKRHHKFPPPQVQVQPPFLGLCSPSSSSSPSPPLTFISHNHNLMHEKLLTLPLLSPSSSPSSPPIDVGFSLSMRACHQQAQALEDKDLILQLKPMSGGGAGASHVIISPKPIRPIGSTIRVGPIRPAHTAHSRPNKKPDEVEADVEAEQLPAVVTDSNNRVRMVNSAYKELVGQPECRWLDNLQTASVAGTRISGGVTLQMASGSDLPNGFSCWARIEWGQESVDALCDVVRLCCDTKDYLFTWRFHTRLVSPTS